MLVAGGVLLVEWAAIIGERIRPLEMFSDGVLIYGWNPFFGPQLTLPLAVLTGWLVAAWLPATLASILKRPIKGA